MLLVSCFSHLPLPASCFWLVSCFWSPTSGLLLLIFWFWNLDSGLQFLITCFWSLASGLSLLVSYFWSPTYDSPLLVSCFSYPASSLMFFVFFWSPASGPLLLACTILNLKIRNYFQKSSFMINVSDEKNRGITHLSNVSFCIPFVYLLNLAGS